MEGQEMRDCVAELQVVEVTADVGPEYEEIVVDAGAEQVWVTANEAADTLEVKVRHIRRLASAGKILRKKDSGRTMYCLAPLFVEEEEEEPASSRAGTSKKSTEEVRAGAQTGAILLSPDTGEHVAAEIEAKDEARLKRLIDAPATDSTVILSEGDVEYLQDDVVPQELLRTNRELMKLVEGVMSRWTEAMTERADAGNDLKTSMTTAAELQQCLTHWQYHAGQLERQVMATAFMAERALDVADEAVATRWKSGKRLATLRERLEVLRAAFR